MKHTLGFLILTGLMSCAPAPEIKHRAPLFKSTENLVVLSEKADKDLISTKFKNSIQLKCDFFVDNRSDFDLTTATNFAGFTVNLANQESPANLVAKMNNGQVFTTGVRVKSFDILPEVTYVDEKGVTHVMKNSPVVELVARGRDVQGNQDQRFQKIIKLNEKKMEVVKDLYPKKYPHILKCELITEIAKEYESDYTEIHPVEENPAPEVTTSDSAEEHTGPQE